MSGGGARGWALGTQKHDYPSSSNMICQLKAFTIIPNSSSISSCTIPVGSSLPNEPLEEDMNPT